MRGKYWKREIEEYPFSRTSFRNAWRATCAEDSGARPKNVEYTFPGRLTWVEPSRSTKRLRDGSQNTFWNDAISGRMSAYGRIPNRPASEFMHFTAPMYQALIAT